MLRKMKHAGSFYPRFGEQISAQIEKWTEGQPIATPDEQCLSLIVPHAGYIYSGACAAKGFHYISEQEFDTLVILHPSHHGMHFDWSLSPFEQYDSPLGRLDLDVQLFAALTRNGGQSAELYLHEQEHSMEIQLPLIKYFFPDALVCPIMIGRPYPEVAQKLARELHEAIAASGKRVGIVVSTDLSHYHNSDRAEQMDGLLTRYLMSRDPEALWQSVIGKRCEACGIGGVLAALYHSAFWEDAQAKVINYTHSGKVSGDNLQVVGYLSALLYTQG